MGRQKMPFFIPPIVLLGTYIVAATGIALGFKSKCSVCNSKMTRNEPCLFDGKPVCSKCGKDLPSVSYDDVEITAAGRCCKHHIRFYEKDIEQRKRNREAVKAVHVFSANYASQISSKLGKHIKTDWYKDRDEAIFQLKILALADSCTVVTQMKYDNRTELDGNYKFSVWKCSGTI